MLDEQREWDVTMLDEVDADLATATTRGDESFGDDLIRHVQITSKWQILERT